MLPIALLMNVGTTERLLMVMTLMIVLIVELINSAIEAVIDRVGAKINPLSGQAKDIALRQYDLLTYYCLQSLRELCWCRW